ncbi:MAG: flagellar type III secretion system pore protein FliP [Acidimicrobiia bacterium]
MTPPPSRRAPARPTRPLRRLAAVALAGVALALLAVEPAGGQEAPTVTAPVAPVVGAGAGGIAAPEVPEVPAVPAVPEVADPTVAAGGASVTLDLGDAEAPSNSILIIIALTLISLAPALMVMLTSFTRIVIVLSLTRNALGLQGVPPNQVLVGLSLFLSLFVMGPTLSQINDEALQPLLAGEVTTAEAYDAASGPIRAFMLGEVDEGELAMFVSASGGERPAGPDDVSMAALVPAFILSELKTAFVIGFIVFIPFLVIDMVVSSSLMSMGMMMLPPVLVSLPFKLLLFVLVDGWDLVVESLLTSFS